MDTLDEVKLILKENAKWQTETAKIVRENAHRQAETDRIVRENDNRERERAVRMDKELAETWRMINQFHKDFGGFTTNAGRETEEIFAKSIEKNNFKVGQYQFNFLDINARRRQSKKSEVEIDLLLSNTKVVGVLEVKSALRASDVEDHFKKRLPNFRKFFPEYKDKKIIGLVAGKVIDEDALNLAHDYGFVVLTTEGQEIKIDDEYARELEL